MSSIFPLPSSGRTSDILIHQRILNQTRSHEIALLRIQEQISTGRRINRPSEDPFAAARAIQLQRLFQQNTQFTSNVSRSSAYLADTESSISEAVNLLREVRGLAVTGVDVATDDIARSGIVQELRHALQRFVDLGNTNSFGRYLFAGSAAATQPYSYFSESVVFDGANDRLRTYVDVGSILSTNVSGLEVFGGESLEVRSTVDLNPVLTEDTRIVDLNGGQGVSLGQIEVSDGTNSTVVDLSSAESLSDVVRLIESNPPFGRQVFVAITNDRLVLDLDQNSGGYLAIREIDGGTTAAGLGIKTDPLDRSYTVTGSDINPALKLSTPLNEILGVRASTVLESTGGSNDVRITARRVGTPFNDFSFNYVDDDLIQASAGLTQGNETVNFSATAVASRAALSFSGTGNNLQLTSATTGTSLNQVEIVVVGAGAIGNDATVAYDAANKVLQVGVDSTGATEVQTVIARINAEGTFSAAYDASDPVDGGYNPNALISAADIGSVRGNTGNTGGDANTYFIHLEAGVSTAQDVLTAINSDLLASVDFEATLVNTDSSTSNNDGSGAVDARVTGITAGGTGDPLDVDSGLRLQLGENVATYTLDDIQTVEQLINKINLGEIPVRAYINEENNSIDLVSRTSGLDFSIGENGGTTATQLGLRTFTAETPLSELNYGRGVSTHDGTDFTIRRNDGSEIEIDVSSALTVGDVVDIINSHPGNQDPTTLVTARLALTGNGIEIVDDNPPGTATVAVVRTVTSLAAIDLGLVPAGQLEGYPGDGPPPTPATLDVGFADPNHLDTAFALTAVVPGTELNGVTVQIVAASASGNEALVNYDSGTKVLTIDVDPTATTANTLVSAVTLEGTFRAELDRNNDAGNNGNGLIPAAGNVGVTAGGSSQPSALPASASLVFPAPNDINTAFDVTANQGGTQFNDVTIVLQNTLAGDNATAVYDPIGKVLTIDIDIAATTANTIIGAIDLEGTFTGSLNTTVDPTNDGSGIVGNVGNLAVTSGGTPEVLSGRDVNAKENQSVFNSVTKLIEALDGSLNVEAANRAAELIEQDVERMLHALADVSTRQRSLAAFEFQLDQQSVNLQTSISDEIDVDLVAAVSNLTQQQAVFQASLQMVGRLMQISLLDFI